MPDRLFTYTHPAAYIFESDKIYSYLELKNKYELSDEMINTLFTEIKTSNDIIEEDNEIIEE